MADELHKVKRYVVMGGSVYYACGGFQDYRGSFDTEDEAKARVEEFLKEHGDYSWAHYVDLETGDMSVKGEAYTPIWNRR